MKMSGALKHLISWTQTAMDSLSWRISTGWSSSCYTHHRLRIYIQSVCQKVGGLLHTLTSGPNRYIIFRQVFGVFLQSRRAAVGNTILRDLLSRAAVGNTIFNVLRSWAAVGNKNAVFSLKLTYSKSNKNETGDVTFKGLLRVPLCRFPHWSFVSNLR